MTARALLGSSLRRIFRKGARGAEDFFPLGRPEGFHRRILERNGGRWFFFEPHVAALYRSILRPGSVALDGGANVGQHTLQMIAAVSPGGLVLAAEPVPELRAQIEDALRQNNVSPASVRIVPAGLWDQPGESEFFQVTNEAQHELSGLRNRHWLEPYPVKKTRVELTTIDAVCANLTRLDFLKLDIEGSEMHALRGGRKTVEKFQPVISFEQDQFSPHYFGYTWQDLFDYFCSLQYDVYDLFGIQYTDAAMFAGCAVWDFVAMPARIRERRAIFETLRASMRRAGVRF